LIAKCVTIDDVVSGVVSNQRGKRSASDREMSCKVHSPPPPKRRTTNTTATTTTTTTDIPSESPSDANDYSKYLDTAVSTALLAGKIIRLRHGEGMMSTSVKGKGSKGSIDVVTETDLQCQNICFGKLRRAFPDHAFIGEEDGDDRTDILSDRPTWIVDPIDGTHNFVHGQKHVCICIGLAVNKVPVLGVVYNPILDEMFHAVRDRGAFCNGRRIRANTNVSDLERALVSTGIGHSRSEAYLQRTFLALRSVVRTPCQCVRMIGSCALGMCDVARGTADVYYEFDVGGPWDTAAAAVVVAESGAKVCHPDGSAFKLSMGKQQILCTNRALLGRVRALPGFSS